MFWCYFTVIMEKVAATFGEAFWESMLAEWRAPNCMTFVDKPKLETTWSVPDLRKV